MDGNLHTGTELLPGDPNECNSNGKLFKEFLIKYPFLTVVNATNLCQQVITRSRICNGKIEKAALDFFVVCFKILPFILKMTIDDHKRLTRFLKNKAVESDHSPIQLYLNMKQSEKCSTRVEIFNFKDPLSLAAFKDETSKSSKNALKAQKMCPNK